MHFTVNQALQNPYNVLLYLHEAVSENLTFLTQLPCIILLRAKSVCMMCNALSGSSHVGEIFLKSKF